MRTKIFILIFSLIALFFHSCSKENEILDSNESMETRNLKAKFPFKGEIVFQSDMDGDNEIYLLTSRGLKKLTDN